MIRSSRFVYGDSGDWTTELTARPWTPADSTVGGSRTAASGVAASYIVRRDGLLELTLRVTEAELATAKALVAFGQTEESFLWYPEASENEPVEVYLETPKAGERWAPARLGEYPRVFDLPIVLRGVDLDPWVAYFDED